MEILIGSNAPVKHKVFWKGVPTDTTSLPTAKFYDITNDITISPLISSATLLFTLTATKSEVDVGVYEIYPTLSYINRNRTFKVVWEYAVDGTSISKEQTLFVVAPYVDIAQAMDVLELGVESSDPNFKSYFDLMEAERYARKMIENHTSQKFTLYDDTNVVYGSGSDTLPLPAKINALHSLYQNDILLVDKINSIDNWNYPTIISDSGFGIRVDRTGVIDNVVYIANGMVPPNINDSYGGAFPQNFIYRVKARYGWAAIPEEIQMATIELMKDYFSKDKLWRNKYMKSIHTFDWQFEYNSSTYNGTGNKYVDDLLSAYVLSQMVVV